MIITISGKAGSGKGTVSKILAKKLGYEYISIGDMKRKLAKEMGLSIFEFNKLGDQHGKAQEFDFKYDEYQQNLELNKNIVLDSRLGFYNQPNSFKVFLDVDDYIGAKRIMQDDRITDKYSDIEEFIKISKKRNITDSERYKKLYGVDHLDLSNFDLVVDTSSLEPEEVVKKILSYFSDFEKLS